MYSPQGKLIGSYIYVSSPFMYQGTPLHFFLEFLPTGESLWVEDAYTILEAMEAFWICYVTQYQTKEA